MATDGADATRRSRRGGNTGDGLSRDETALGVLRQCVLEGGWKPVRDPDNVMARIWVKKDGGGTRRDGVDGVDWIKEDGFTVKKYAAFWRKEMAEFDDVIIEWSRKLPSEATEHLDKSLFEEEEDDDDGGDGDGTAAEVAAKESTIEAAKLDTPTRGRPRKPQRATATKKKKEETPGSGGDDEGGRLSRDETALGVLRQCVLQRGGWKPVRDPNNAMAILWVKMGGNALQDGVDGVDWIKEDGFTVKKYAAFWRKTMADFEDVVVEWAHKLPPEATEHLDESLLEEEDDDNFGDDDDGYDDGAAVEAAAKESLGANNAAKQEKPKRGHPRKPPKNLTEKKKKQKLGPDGNGKGDGRDDLPAHLVALGGEWFAALEVLQEEGRSDAKRGRPGARATEKRERADLLKNLFVHNAVGCPKMAEYKRATLDPLAKRAIAQVDEFVAARAALLRKECLEALSLANYVFTEAEPPRRGM